MKTTAHVEAGALMDGTRVFRMRCDACNRTGVWQKNLNAVEHTIAIHDRHEHARKAVA